MFDVLLRGGRVIDGSGSPWRQADIAINGDCIIAVVPSLNGEAKDNLDISGLCAAPGFIDIHVHADLQILVDNAWACETTQGVTTIAVGQDGLGLAPLSDGSAQVLRRELKAWNGDPEDFEWNWRSFDDYLVRLQSARPALNLVALVPHGTVRLLVMGMADRSASQDELDRMQTMVATCMNEGGMGLSAGLTYAPGSSARGCPLVRRN